MKSYSEATSRGGVVSGMLGFLKAPDFHCRGLHGATDGRIRGGQIYFVLYLWWREGEGGRNCSIDIILLVWCVCFTCKTYGEVLSYLMLFRR